MMLARLRESFFMNENAVQLAAFVSLSLKLQI